MEQVEQVEEWDHNDGILPPPPLLPHHVLVVDHRTDLNSYRYINKKGLAMEVDDVTTQCTLLAGQLHIVHPCFDMQNGGYQWLPLVFDLLLSMQTHIKTMASSRIT